MSYVQKKNPFPVTSCGRRRTFMQDSGESPLKKRTKEERQQARAERKEFRVERAAERRSKKGKEPRRTIGPGKNFNKANPTGTGADAGGGMTQKGVNEYKRKNPGSKLKTAVTTKPSKLKPGSKAANRRKSFCARSKGWTGERGRAARRRWNC